MCRIHYQNNERISHVCCNICNDIKLHFHDSDSRIFNFNLLMQRVGTYVFTSFTYQNFFEAIIIFGPSTQKTLANRIHGITHLAGTTAHQSTGRNMQQGQHCQKSGYGYNNRRKITRNIFFISIYLRRCYFALNSCQVSFNISLNTFTLTRTQNVVMLLIRVIFNLFFLIF